MNECASKPLWRVRIRHFQSFSARAAHSFPFIWPRWDLLGRTSHLRLKAGRAAPIESDLIRLPKKEAKVMCAPRAARSFGCVGRASLRGREAPPQSEGWHLRAFVSLRGPKNPRRPARAEPAGPEDGRGRGRAERFRTRQERPFATRGAPRRRKVQPIAFPL